MFNQATKVRASNMLAALRGDRFALHPEQDLIALGIPYDKRRSTQDVAIAARKLKPFNPKHSPILSESAHYYLCTTETGWRQTNHSNNWIRKNYDKAKAAFEKEQTLGPLDPPVTVDEGNTMRLFRFHRRYIDDWRDTCLANWNALTDVEKLWFDHPNPSFRTAWDFPLLAPVPYCFYPTEETPERLRQIELLEWFLEQCDKAGVP